MLKVIPKLYKYIKASKATSILNTRRVMLNKVSTFSLDVSRLREMGHSAEEIKNAYRAYQRNPYINNYLRAGTPLSKENNELISCLQQAIRTSEPVSGRFVRGLTLKMNQPINTKTVSEYIFNNPGFTSTAPENSWSIANCFAVGKTGVTVEFDITKPMKAFKANNWEAIFDTKAFTPDKFDIIQTGKKLFEVIQK